MDRNRRLKYKVEVDWSSFPEGAYAFDGLPEQVEELRFRREKNSHRGISRLKHLRTLVVFCANQDCLEEISELPQLETLYLSQLMAGNLECLGRCGALRHLIIKGAGKVSTLSWLSVLPRLDSLLLENFKLITDIADLRSLPSLRAFGFEGSMWTTQRLDSFQPLSFLPNLEALFLTACRPISDGLRPLFRLARLQYLEIAGRYPDKDFLALREALPQLRCGWFQAIDEYGSIKAFIKARVKAATNVGRPGHLGSALKEPDAV